MKSLYQTLQDIDEAIVLTIAESWGLKGADRLKAEKRIDQLHDLMLDASTAEGIWDGLDDTQRQALQTLLGSGGKMSMPMFTRLFGEIRKMGRGQIEREQPHKTTESPAEALFYTGLIAEAFEMTNAGAQPVIYIPEDLKLVLPVHKTAYDDLETDIDVPEMIDSVEALDVSDVAAVRAADTSLVDDLTTLLAFLQLRAPELDGERLGPGSTRDLTPYLLVPDSARLAFLLLLAISADLVDVQEGRCYPRRADARRWLTASRAEQLQILVQAWAESGVYRELWHIAGLKPERGGTLDAYDPTVAREAIVSNMRDLVPESDWWAVETFIQAVKENDPDFQRPGGDYDSWYIQDSSGEYVRGFESWDTVEGALIAFLIEGPLHWLGLVDLGEDAARLTAYGRATLGLIDWPLPNDPPDQLRIDTDNTLLVSRKISRIDRFQLARFTTWVALEGGVYRYKLDAKSIAKAEKQGINTGHIRSFLARTLDNLPTSIDRLLENWRSGDAAGATLEQLTVLRTQSADVMNDILNTPELRRYLGGQLGPMAVIVRAGQADALGEALLEHGIQPDVLY